MAPLTLAVSAFEIYDILIITTLLVTKADVLNISPSGRKQLMHILKECQIGRAHV
jgi:hypothetical protein